MSLDDTQYREFLEQLHDLAEFRADYLLDNVGAGVDLEDPDVKRIIEALAFFNARTHCVSKRYLAATRRRLYQQFFSYLLTPLPAMAMMQATPTGQLTEALSLPAGTEFGLQPENKSLVVFRSMKNLRILPMRLSGLKKEALTDQGIRLLLSFQASYPLNEQPETLSLFINYLNDVPLSFKVLQFLQQSLQSAGVQFGDYDAGKSFSACKFSFGSNSDAISSEERRHPLEVERYFFHFPQQELYLDIDTPSAPRNWTSFTLILDCEQMWPGQLRLNRDLFQLFVVPVANSQRSMAQPVLCDGTEERYSIRYPNQDLHFCLQEVSGIYEVTDEGMKTLRPGILAGDDGSYEIEQGSNTADGGNVYWLVPHFPSAFTKVRTLVVDALWQQPWYDDFLEASYSLQPYRRQIIGVKWEFGDMAIAHAENRGVDNDTGYIHLLTLMHKPFFKCQDIRDLLFSMGSVSSGKFKSVYDSLVDVTMEEQPLGREEERFSKQIYTLHFKPQLDRSIELIDIFVHHVGLVLEQWLSDAVIETHWEIMDEIKRPVSGERP
jgi:type VI secretion system protein ImpG